jgi:hypothetical protein
MGLRWVVVAAVLGLLGTDVVAQPASEPPALKLPVGARVRVRTVAAPEPWMKGYLAGADSGSIALLPEGMPPFAGSELRLPRETISRLEIATGKKRHWLAGLVIGAAAGVAVGFAMDVDSTRCEFDDNYFCSRGEAVALMGGAWAALGAGIGSLVKSDVWIPVALDALGPPPARVGRVGPALRATPGGLSLGLSVRF